MQNSTNLIFRNRIKEAAMVALGNEVKKTPNTNGYKETENVVE